MLEGDIATAKIKMEILPFEILTLSEFFQKKAEVELDETPERRIQCLKEIKNRIKKETSLEDSDFNEDFLLQFLRVKKFNVDKAFSQLKLLMELRRKNPHVFSNYRFEDAVEALKHTTFLPWRCQDGCAVIHSQLGNWNPDEFPVEAIKKMAMIFLLQCARNPMTQVNGIKSIYDVNTISVKILKLVNPRNLYFIACGILRCVPLRYREIHIVNNSIIFRASWTIFQYFLPEKLKKRFFFHSSHETLLNYFPSEVLPVQYGGSLENFDMSPWLEKIIKPEELEIMMGKKYPDGYKSII